MTLQRAVALTALTAAAWTAPAQACVPPPPFAPLPGESREELQARSKAANQAKDDEFRRQFQARLYDSASAVMLGRVSKSVPIIIGNSGFDVTGHRVTIEPVTILRGQHDGHPVLLSDRTMTSCGLGGDGNATNIAEGGYALVFTRVARNAGEPAIDYGIPLTEVRDVRVVDALYDIGLGRFKKADEGKAAQ